MTITPEERAELRRLHDEAELGPWIAVTPFTGKDWLVCSLGTDCEGKDWAVTTDGLHASECRGNGPEWDAKLIVAMRNAMPRLLDALEAAERERDRLREQGGELFLSGQVAKLREERDAAIAKCEQLSAERPISVDMYDHVSAELEVCKAKLAALVKAVESDKLPLMMTVREALAAAKEPTP